MTNINETATSTHKILLAILLAFCLFATACGSASDGDSVSDSDDSASDGSASDDSGDDVVDDDVGGDDDGDGDDPAFTPDSVDGECETWASEDVSADREQSADMVSQTTETVNPAEAWRYAYCLEYGPESGITFLMSTSGVPCAYHSTRIVVLGSLFEEGGGTRNGFQAYLEDLGLDFELDPEPPIPVEEQGDLGFSLWSTTGDPLEVTRALAQNGVVAAPDYVLFTAPGRMMFPGSLPVPAVNDAITIPMPQPPSEPSEGDDIQPSLPIHVFDTGGPDGAGEFDDYAYDMMPNTYVAGHGTFIDGILREVAPSADIHHWRVNSPKSLVATEFDLLLAAQRARKMHNETFGEVPMISNISMGTTVCLEQWPDGFGAAPLVTQRVLEGVLLTGDEDVIVAAAGNGGSNRWVAFPAGFSAWWSYEAFHEMIDPLEYGLPDSYYSGILIDQSRTPTHYVDRVVSVGAPAAPTGLFAMGEIEYSTVGSWVTVGAQGCHESTYPNEFYQYPGTESVAQFPHGARGFMAEWCGTSFATPIVTGHVAREMGNGASLDREQLALTFPPPPTPTPS